MTGVFVTLEGLKAPASRPTSLILPLRCARRAVSRC